MEKKENKDIIINNNVSFSISDISYNDNKTYKNSPFNRENFLKYNVSEMIICDNNKNSNNYTFNSIHKNLNLKIKNIGDTIPNESIGKGKDFF